MEFEKQLEEWMKLDYVLPEDLPNIELYMDQVTTFLEEQLKNTKRFEEDKIFTKTMINNYTKNHLLPPSNKKKYSRNHMILLIYIYYKMNLFLKVYPNSNRSYFYIYYLKNFLSISDIKNLLDPLNEHFDDQDSKNSFYTIYNEIFKLEHDHNTAIRDSIADVFHKSEATFAELKESKKKEQLQQFAFITLLGYDIYLRKQVIEKMIDELYQPESNNKAEKKKKK